VVVWAIRGDQHLNQTVNLQPETQGEQQRNQLISFGFKGGLSNNESEKFGTNGFQRPAKA